MSVAWFIFTSPSQEFFYGVGHTLEKLEDALLLQKRKKTLSSTEKQSLLNSTRAEIIGWDNFLETVVEKDLENPFLKMIFFKKYLADLFMNSLVQEMIFKPHSYCIGAHGMFCLKIITLTQSLMHQLKSLEKTLKNCQV